MHHLVSDFYNQGKNQKFRPIAKGKRAPKYSFLVPLEDETYRYIYRAFADIVIARKLIQQQEGKMKYEYIVLL